MALKTRKTRKRASITSLIDVIFLLLLFFMLSSTFSRFSEVEIATTAPEGGRSNAVGQRPVLAVGHGDSALDGTRLADTDIAMALETLRSHGQNAITVTPEANVTTQRLIDMLVVVAGVQGLEVRVLEPAP